MASVRIPVGIAGELKPSLLKFQHHARTVKYGITFIRNTSIGGKYYNTSVKVVSSPGVRSAPNLPKHLQLQNHKSPTIGQLSNGGIGPLTLQGVKGFTHTQLDNYVDVSASVIPDQPIQSRRKPLIVDQSDHEPVGLFVKVPDGITEYFSSHVVLSGLLFTLFSSTLFPSIQVLWANPPDVECTLELVSIIIGAVLIIQGINLNLVRDGTMQLPTRNQLLLLCGICLIPLIPGANAGGDTEIRNAMVENAWENYGSLKAAVSFAVGLFTVGIGGGVVWKMCNRRILNRNGEFAVIDQGLAGTRYVNGNPDLEIHNML